MAIDLGDLIEDLQSEVDPPGTDSFPNAVEDDWLAQLQNAFWEAKLYGFFGDFTESDGVISPISGTDDLDRTNQQLIILFAGARVLRNELRNINSTFRAKAGPVEFEQGKSAQLLRDLLADVQNKIKWQLENLGRYDVAYIDGVLSRADSIAYGGTTFFTSRGW